MPFPQLPALSEYSWCSVPAGARARSAIPLSRHSHEFGRRGQRAVGVDAHHRAGPCLARLTLALKFGAIFLGSAVQDALRGMTQAAGPTPQRVLVGMAQYHFVHVDVAMIAWQFLRLRVIDRDLRHEAHHREARRFERSPR